ncbi:MAG TPA: VCBS repeat-containing protein [Tepidisphaeraceae bacterium]|nr:VCBS repeat-containing protein [Tepidisphaeraceae bacterium]
MKWAWVQVLGLVIPWVAPAEERPWVRHVIDDGLAGADGVRLGDVNGDGRPDVTTGWEEGGTIRVCLHPGKEKVKEKWPGVSVGKVGSPEDAVFVDLDGDGNVDVVSSCEGKTRSIFFHFAPAREKILEAKEWKTVALPASAEKQWMFCLPMQVDGVRGIDLVCGGKNKGAEIGWFESPLNPRKVEDWIWHPMREAGWIMSLVAVDMDGDGYLDVLFSDRRGARNGAYWLENPTWKEHAIGAVGKEAMFLARGDLDEDGLEDVVVATRPKDLIWLKRLDKNGDRWESHVIAIPEEAGTAKGVAIGDVDGDGKMDLVFSCENAKEKLGVMWMKQVEGKWEAHDIGGKEGEKFDLVELIDLDGDGDLDVMTTEERELNAVIWYQNPAK